VNEKSRGIPAYLFSEEVKQAVREIKSLKSRGDRMLNWNETNGGYTVWKNSNGQFVYAELINGGYLVPSRYKVSATMGVPAGLEQGLGFSKDQLSIARKAYYPVADVKANPNPFTESVNIRFDLPESSLVKIEVYDMVGKQLELINEEFLPAGSHTLNWFAPEQFPPVCIITLTASGIRMHGRVVRLKQ